jgi:hypothetical protein
VKFWGGILGTFIVGLGAAVSVQAAPRQGPCAEIRAACEQAGFVQGSARAGDGLFLDCIAPVMRGTPQPRRATNLSHRSICSSSQIAKRRIRTSASVTRRHRKRPSHSVEASPFPRAATPQVAPARQRNVPPSQAVEPPVQASPPQPSATPQVAPAPQTNNGAIGEE